VLRFAGIALLIILLLAVCFWLNVPRSVPLFVQGIALERYPIEFDFEFVGLDPHLTSVPVNYVYMPLTPIYGITKHWTTIISPAQVDTILRTQVVPVEGGHLRWSAPRGLTGLSNYRLYSFGVGDQGAPYELVGTSPQDGTKPPRALNIPKIAVSGGVYDFDGPIVLWRGQGEPTDENPYGYATRDLQQPAQILWDGLRSVRARVQLTPYALSTFVVPTLWAGDGWTNQAYQISRPHATKTDQLLKLARGVSVPVPYMRECTDAPQFAVVTGRDVPAWAKLYGLWRPIPRAEWDAFRRGANAPGITMHFNPAARGEPSLDRVETLSLSVAKPGHYRLFGACPNGNYDSVAVAWLEIEVSG
jgi:hypothetical protein